MISKLIELIEADCDQMLSESYGLLKSLQNQHILITGGTGFVGTWIAELIVYLNKNYNFNTKLTLLARNADAVLIKPTSLGRQKNVILKSKDLRNIIDLDSDINYIIHSAANPDNREHSTNPLRVIDTIVHGTSALFEKSTRLGSLSKILNISSGLVYGNQPQELDSITESYLGKVDCSQISSVYAESKRMGETICAAYRSQHRLEIVNARPFAFIGPYQLIEKPWAINNFIRDSLMGGPIRILGDGGTTRSYMYGSEMAYWMLRILVSGKSGHNYNVGSPHSISLKDLATKVSNNFSPSPAILSRNVEESESIHSKFIPNVDVVKKELGLDLKIGIDQALRKTIEWNKLLA